MGMAKATLEFDLENEDDKMVFDQMVSARDLCMALLDIDNALRNAYKYQESLPTTTAEAADRWRQVLHDTLSNYNVNLDNLIR
jgi:hypothetical protein